MGCMFWNHDYEAVIDRARAMKNATPISFMSTAETVNYYYIEFLKTEMCTKCGKVYVFKPEIVKYGNLDDDSNMCHEIVSKYNAEHSPEAQREAKNKALLEASAEKADDDWDNFLSSEDDQ